MHLNERKPGLWVPSRSLVHPNKQWLWDEIRVAVPLLDVPSEVVGNGMGTLENTASWLADDLGAAVSLTGGGADDCIQLPFTYNLTNIGSQFTVAVLATPTAIGSSQCLIDTGESDSTGGIRLIITASGQMRIFIRQTDDTTDNETSLAVATAGQRDLFLVTVDGTSIVYYLNAEVADTDAFETNPDDLHDSTGVWRLGCNTDGSLDFGGLIHGGWLWNRTFAPGDVEEFARDMFAMVRFARRIMAPVGFVWEQEGYRWYDDDADEDESAPLAAQDIGITRAKGTTTRLRELLNATGNPAAIAARLRYRKKGDTPWIPFA